jgi:signal transduction histidine kinase
MRVAERTAQLMRAEEQARHRIARELHDEMGQQVTALKVGLEALKERSVDRRRIKQLSEIVQDLDDHIDGLAHRLRPTALDESGLVSALSSYVEHFTERFGIPVDFHSAGMKGKRLPAVVETTLYRLVQEALTNVLKHAHAGTASVILERRKTDVQLIIEDDGSGFTVDEAGEHRLGLVGMRERVALLGGTLNIESSAESGTSIFVRLTI